MMEKLNNRGISPVDVGLNTACGFAVRRASASSVR